MAKVSCDSCGSSDGREVYEDGHTYCFVCHDWQAGTSTQPTTEKRKMGEPDFLFGRAYDLVDRNLRSGSLNHFRYHVATTRGQEVQVANYYDRETGELCAQKVRTPDKDFYAIGDMSKAGLFGESVWERGGKRLVITEGEVDALSYGQATGLSWPVCSVPLGAQGAAKAIKNSLEFIESFDHVGHLVEILAADMSAGIILRSRVPVRGEVVEHPDGLEFEVMDADPRRIKRLRVRLPEAAE